MIKHTVTYTDFNGIEKTKDLYFHLSKASVITSSDEVYNELIDMGEKLQDQGALLERTGGEFDETDPFSPKTQMVARSARMVGRLLDRLVDLAYGEKSEDGSRFLRGEEVISNFKQSAAYEAFVEGMLTNQDGMLKFIERLLEK